MPIRKVDFDQLMVQAVVKLPGVSEQALHAEFYDVLSEFLNDSSIWTENVTVPYMANTVAYRVSVSEGQIIRLNSVGDWGTMQPLELTQVIPPGTPGPLFVPAIMPEIGLIVTRNIPDTNGFWQVNLVLNCKLPLTKGQMPEAPEWILPIWHVALLDGLLGKMMNDPSKSYTNAAGAAYHLKRFRDGIARARISKLRANTIGTGAWRFPQQFRSLSQQSGVPAIGSSNERLF
jgi:hypothetical protein